jgi:hypothetical protein
LQRVDHLDALLPPVDDKLGLLHERREDLGLVELLEQHALEVVFRLLDEGVSDGFLGKGKEKKKEEARQVDRCLGSGGMGGRTGWKE